MPSSFSIVVVGGNFVGVVGKLVGVVGNSCFVALDFISIVGN